MPLGRHGVVDDKKGSGAGVAIAVVVSAAAAAIRDGCCDVVAVAAAVAGMVCDANSSSILGPCCDTSAKRSTNGSVLDGGHDWVGELCCDICACACVCVCRR